MSARRPQERRQRDRRGGVGVYGGTFNPIHLGHLRAAEEVAELLDLERMLFVPSAEPPHKEAAASDVIAPACDRLHWVRLAVKDNPRFEADPIEVERQGLSYAVHTLSSLGERLAPQLPVFIVGHDAFVEMGSWRDPETLFARAHMAVTTRPPVRGGRLDAWLPECVRDDFEVAADGRSAQHRRAGTWIRLVELTALDISATEIRRRLREGHSVRYLLPAAVQEAVESSRHYGGSGRRGRQAPVRCGIDDASKSTPGSRRASSRPHEEDGE
jgi:nicotinate-nucleotide adenylyltransferase